MNSENAVEGSSRSMRQLIRNTSPSVPRNRTSTAGPLKIIWPNDDNPMIAPLALVTTAAWNVSQEAMPVSATPRAMLVVDADHVGPQALIDRNCPVRTDAASGSRVVPFEIRHGRTSLYSDPQAG